MLHSFKENYSPYPSQSSLVLPMVSLAVFPSSLLPPQWRRQRESWQGTWWYSPTAVASPWGPSPHTGLIVFLAIRLCLAYQIITNPLIFTGQLQILLKYNCFIKRGLVSDRNTLTPNNCSTMKIRYILDTSGLETTSLGYGRFRFNLISKLCEQQYAFGMSGSFKSVGNNLFAGLTNKG